jgi:hypothetical protein
MLFRLRSIATWSKNGIYLLTFATILFRDMADLVEVLDLLLTKLCGLAL